MSSVRLALIFTMAAVALVGCSSNQDLTSPNGGGFGDKAIIGIGDFVWNDMNRDGIQDAEETGVMGVVVSLIDSTGFVAAVDTTDIKGVYLLDGFATGKYHVHFMLPDGYAFSMQGAGADSTLDSDADPATGLTAFWSVPDTISDSSIDAGMYALAVGSTLGDRVWHDENENGNQDDGEMGMAGVMVTLSDCTGLEVATTATDTNGIYTFADVTAGDYQLSFALPDGYIFTAMHADSSTSATDSDVDPASGATDCLTLADGVTDLDVDAGMYLEFVGTGCAHGKGYWKNNLAEVAEMLTITLGDEGGAKSLVVDDTEKAYGVLQQHTYGHPSNGITKLYAHLLTAKLSIANGADGSGAEAAINSADAFLADHDWSDWDSLSKSEKRMVQKMKGSFKVYSVSDDCEDNDHDHDDDCDDDDDEDDDS